MQRLFDLIFAGTALLLLCPLMLLIMLLLSLTGEGEVFFLQDRVGKGGKTFKLFKFATMLKNSPSISTGTVTLKNDPRILPVGKFLRKTKLNELPQLLNIIRGDMSIVGPRPQTPRCFAAFPKDSRHIIIKVRPGLSGIGSIVFRNEDEILINGESSVSFYDNVIAPYKGELEIWYVDHQNLFTYFGVIVITVWVVLFSNSKAVWATFKDLPIPPDALKLDLKYN